MISTEEAVARMDALNSACITLKEQLAAIDALHQAYMPSFRDSECPECGVVWPCRTASILHPELDDKDGRLSSEAREHVLQVMDESAHARARAAVDAQTTIIG